MGRKGGIDADEGFSLEGGDAHMGGVGAFKEFFSLFFFLFFGDLIGLPRSCADVPRPGWLAGDVACVVAGRRENAFFSIEDGLASDDGKPSGNGLSAAW